MHNDFSKSIGEDKLDFSSLNTLTPREDSWSKICARLDAADVSVKTEAKKNNILPFRLLSAIPLAASLVLVGISVMLTAFDNDESSPISMNNVTSTELASWYGNLGNSDYSENDEYETLDNSITISYLMKE